MEFEPLSWKDENYKPPKKSKYKRKQYEDCYLMVLGGYKVVGQDIIFDYGVKENIPNTNKTEIIILFSSILTTILRCFVSKNIFFVKKSSSFVSTSCNSTLSWNFKMLKNTSLLCRNSMKIRIQL